MVINWIGDNADLVSFGYSNGPASCLGETLVSGGAVTSIEQETGLVAVGVFMTNEEGEVISLGSTIVRFLT
ncbi:MAG: hypothetical protein CMM47_02940 [Rhodospirillaceae bacterium]|nr:hypothetical protein [Rhodospirillaceae bacterium]